MIVSWIRPGRLSIALLYTPIKYSFVYSLHSHLSDRYMTGKRINNNRQFSAECVVYVFVTNRAEFYDSDYEQRAFH